MTVRSKAVLALCASVAALALTPAAARATGSCETQSARFTYTTTTARATFVVRPSCFGPRRSTGDVTVTYSGRRCTVTACTTLPVTRRVCRWSTQGCARTIGFSHPVVERASYQFDVTFVNADTYPVVAAGAETVASTCTSLAVTFACTV